MNHVKKVIQNVLKKIKPSESERKKLEAVINFCKKNIEKELAKQRINAEVCVGGSAAKDTWLSGQHDIDFFVRFNKSYDGKDIGKLLSKPIKTIFKKAETVHGTRDYYRTEHEGFTLEFIPVIEIDSPEYAKNSMDASLFHVDYVKEKTAEKTALADNIRLLKAFAKSAGVYGAETHVSGLSGYVTELLMIHFGSFETLLAAAEHLKPPILIDIEQHYPNKQALLLSIDNSKLKTPVVMIDPVFKQRNASAAMQEKKFLKLLLQLRLFSRNPTTDFFREKPCKLKEMQSKSRNRGTILVFKKMKLKTKMPETFLAKIKSKTDRVFAILEHLNINVYDYGFFQEKEDVVIFFEMETLKISKTYKHLGPPVWIEPQHFNAFIKKWKHVYVSGTNLATDLKRSTTNISDIVLRLLEGELKDV